MIAVVPDITSFPEGRDNPRAQLTVPVSLVRGDGVIYPTGNNSHVVFIHHNKRTVITNDKSNKISLRCKQSWLVFM